MSVADATSSTFSLTQGAFSVEAQAGQTVTVKTQAGSFELVSPTSVNAVASFQNGEFAAVSKDGLLSVTSNGLVTSVEAGEAFLFNDKGAQLLNVQAAGAAGVSVLNSALIIGGIIVGTAVVGEAISDGDDAVSASPAE